MENPQVQEPQVQVDLLRLFRMVGEREAILDAMREIAAVREQASIIVAEKAAKLEKEAVDLRARIADLERQAIERAGGAPVTVPSGDARTASPVAMPPEVPDLTVVPPVAMPPAEARPEDVLCPLPWAAPVEVRPAARE